MISIKKAEKLISQNLPPRGVEKISLERALGRFLYADVDAVEPSPRFTNSSMDGFALRYKDWKKGSRLFEIAGESRAGVPFEGKIEQDQCIRVSTGALLPRSMDCVVPFEYAVEKKGSIGIAKSSEKWQYVRKQGSEFETGTLLFKAGDQINPVKIGILAAQGILEVDVYAQPRVAIISTGSELVPYDSQPDTFQIRESNTLMLEKSVEKSGGKIVSHLKVTDDLRDTENAIKSALNGTDIIISSGGISVGRHDHVRSACANLGFRELFWRVDQKPGRPLFMATVSNTLFFGLPGNPVSTYMTYIYYVHTAIRMLLGDPMPQKKVPCLWHSDDTTPKNIRSRFIRVRIEEVKGVIRAIGIEHKGSHMLSTLAHADGYIVLPPDSEIKRGELVQVILFPSF